MKTVGTGLPRNSTRNSIAIMVYHSDQQLRERKLAQDRWNIYSQRRMQALTSSAPCTSLVFWLAGMKQESLCAHTKARTSLAPWAN